MIVDQPPKLTLAGFHLRQLQRADVGAWFRYLTDPQVYEHTSWAVTKPDDLLSLFEDYKSPQACPNVWTVKADKSMRELAKTRI